MEESDVCPLLIQTMRSEIYGEEIRKDNIIYVNCLVKFKENHSWKEHSGIIVEIQKFNDYIIYKLNNDSYINDNDFSISFT